MATFGQGINAQLGAIDYSPIQRGSAVGAQLAAQGGSMIGQGLANLGQEVGKGVETYFKKQDMMKAQIGEIAAFAASDPEYLATLPPKFLEKARAGEFNPREVSEFYANGAMTRKIKNEKIQNDLAIAHTAAYNAAANDDAAKKSIAIDQKDAADLVGSTLVSGGKALNLTGVAPRVAALSQALWNSTYGDKVKVDETVKQYKKQDEAGAKRLQSFLKPVILDVKGHSFLQTVDANGDDAFVPLNETEAAQREIKQNRLSGLIDTVADAQGRNDLEASSRAEIQILAENPSLAQTPSELKRVLKTFIAGRGKNINERLPRGVTDENYRNPNFRVESISPSAPAAPTAMAQPTAQNFGTTAEPPAYRNGVMVQPTQMPVSPQSTQMSVVNGNPENYPSSFAAPTGGTIRDLQAQQATSAQLPNRPNIQQAGEGSYFAPPAQPTPVSTPYDSGYDQGYGDDRGGGQSSLGASSVTPSPAVNQTVVAAPAPEQTANLQKGAARFVANATSTASTIANNANELYLAAEVGNAILNDPVLKADVKDKFGKLLSKVFNPKVRAMARLSPQTAKAVLSGATKVAKVSGQLVRPAMMVNSLDSIVGKYVGKSFPEQETTRATQAAASVLALWAESSTDNKKDEAMALLAQKSRYLMSSGMNREKKLAKNAEYLRLMNVLMERRTPRRGSLQNFNTGEIAQFDQSFSQ